MNIYFAWVQKYKRSAFVVAVTLIFPLAITFYAIFGFLNLGQSYQNEINQLEPRAARLMGLVISEVQLAASVDEADKLLEELIYPAEEEVSASLQQDILEIITSAGMTDANHRMLAMETLDSFEKIKFRFTVIGSMNALDTVLTELAAFEPLILVESLDAKPNRIVRDRPELSQQAVTATLVVVSLRALP